MSPNLPIEDLGVGAYLAREREERGISLTEVSEKTRIRIYYLEHIEAEDFDQLPSIPVGRGFVRAYAEYIGVDSDEVARFYNQKVGGRSEDIDEDLGSKILYSAADSEEKPKYLLAPVLAVVLFILVSGSLLWYARGKTVRLGELIGFSVPVKEAGRPGTHQPGNEKQENVNVKNVVPSEKPSKEIKMGNESQPRKPGFRETSLVDKPAAGPSASAALPAGPGGEKPTTPSFSEGNRAGAPGSPAAPASRLTLKIKAVEDTWLRVVVDQKEAVEVFLTTGSEKLWKGNDKFILTVGNAQGTRVFLNDASVSLPKTASNVIRKFLITDKVAELKPNFAGN
ncbi:MAG: RodZ domain-containing protein [bacterium]